MENKTQRKFYDGIRNKFRKTDEIDLLPKFMRIYFALENKALDDINRLYYAICDYLFLDIEPCKQIRNSKDWLLIEDYLDEEKQDVVNYGDL